MLTFLSYIQIHSQDLQSKVAEEQTRVKDGLAREAALKATVADLERQLRGATGRGDGLQVRGLDGSGRDRMGWHCRGE